VRKNPSRSRSCVGHDLVDEATLEQNSAFPNPWQLLADGPARDALA